MLTGPICSESFGENLSTVAGAFITEAATPRRKIAVSSITLAEVVYLIEKKRLPPSAPKSRTCRTACPHASHSAQPHPPPMLT
jgi:hypothetical protein